MSQNNRPRNNRPQNNQPENDQPENDQPENGPFPARRGLVFMAEGRRPFRDIDNAPLRDHNRLPLFTARPPGTFPRDALRPNREQLFDQIDAFADPAVVDRARARVNNEYGTLQQHPYYRPDQQIHGFTQQIATVHNLLFFGLLNHRELEHHELNTLLGIISYGMQDSMTWLEQGFILRTPPPPRPGILNGPANIPTRASREANGTFRTDHQLNTADLRPLRSRIRGRRWIVAPVNTDGQHWSMTIFDREQGHLYIFDTAGGERNSRIMSMVRVWADFWRQLGHSHHFQYFVPETTPQVDGWECGHLCIAWLMLTLRCRDGNPMTAEDSNNNNTSNVRHDRTGRGESVREPYLPATSSLPLIDWHSRNAPSPRVAFNHAIHIIRHMLHHELGLSDPQGIQIASITFDPDRVNKNVNGSWTFDVGFLTGVGYENMKPLITPTLRIQIETLGTTAERLLKSRTERLNNGPQQPNNGPQVSNNATEAVDNVTERQQDGTDQPHDIRFQLRAEINDWESNRPPVEFAFELPVDYQPGGIGTVTGNRDPVTLRDQSNNTTGITANFCKCQKCGHRHRILPNEGSPNTTAPDSDPSGSGSQTTQPPTSRAAQSANTMASTTQPAPMLRLRGDHEVSRQSSIGSSLNPEPVPTNTPPSSDRSTQPTRRPRPTARSHPSNAAQQEEGDTPTPRRSTRTRRQVEHPDYVDSDTIFHRRSQANTNTAAGQKRTRTDHEEQGDDGEDDDETQQPPAKTRRRPAASNRTAGTNQQDEGESSDSPPRTKGRGGVRGTKSRRKR